MKDMFTRGHVLWEDMSYRKKYLREEMCYMMTCLMRF